MDYDGGLYLDSGGSLFFLLARVVLGGVLIAHGYNHAYGGGKLEGTAKWFHSMGFRPAHVHAKMSAYGELTFGGLLVLGLLTPFACAGVIGTMAVAFWANHKKNGFFIFRPGEGYEYVLTLTFFALFLATTGPGLWSLDQAIGVIDYKDVDQGLVGWGGALIAGGLGVAGAAALLITSWKPDRPEGT